MSRPVLFGEVQVRDRAAVCVKPDGSTAVDLRGKPLTFETAFGGLRRYDAGKRIFKVGGIFQMENDDQRARRLASSHA